MKFTCPLREMIFFLKPNKPNRFTVRSTTSLGFEKVLKVFKAKSTLLEPVCVVIYCLMGTFKTIFLRRRDLTSETCHGGTCDGNIPKGCC